MVFVPYPPAIKVVAVRMALEGFSKSHICQTLGKAISRQSFQRWMLLYRETKAIVCSPESYKTRGRPPTLSSEECRFMVELVRSEPGLFLEEMRQRLFDSTGTLLSIQAIHENLVNRLSITLKKPSTVNSRKSLVAKFAFVERMEFFPANFLVFTDESSFCDKDLLRSFARSKQGTPAQRLIINQNPERWSLLPAISLNGLVALTTTSETFQGEKFEHFLEFDLLPRMNRYPGVNSVLVCDNAMIHRGARVKDLCNAAGVRIIYLPPYCPELNPIELCFGAIKTQLRLTQSLSYVPDTEWEIRRVTGEIIDETLCSKVYAHCGYRIP